MRFKQFLAEKTLKLFGWKVTGHRPGLPKGIFVVVPHTHWLDFPLGLLARAQMGIDIRFLAKKSLFTGLKGHLFRWLGGYPVERTRRTGFVQTVAEIFKNHERFHIAIAPEGTRKKVEHLRTGFYYIALEAEIPMYLTKFDFAAKEVIISEPVYADPDDPDQIKSIENYFRGVKGKVPRYSF